MRPVAWGHCFGCGYDGRLKGHVCGKVSRAVWVKLGVEWMIAGAAVGSILGAVAWLIF